LLRVPAGGTFTRTTLGDPSSPAQARCRPIGNIRTADARIQVALKEFKGEADEAGGLDEAKLPQGSIVGRLGPFPAKTTCDGVFALTPGTYLLIDDITTLRPNGAVVSNAANGMVAQLTVV